MILSSKERAYLKSLSSAMDVVINIGKASLTDEVINAVDEAFNNRELIKIGVLKNCADDSKEIATSLAENTKSTVVHVIGRKIVLYRGDKNNPKIMLPK